MKVLTLACILLISCWANAESNADLVNTKVDRTLDMTTHLVYVKNVITVENKATSGALKSYTFVVEPLHARNVAFIGAKVCIFIKLKK